ncbi:MULTISPECIES: type I-E CRISPR-associated protein Cas6/Cse3/CasE [Collinsella]|uniref:type I-E CRISPR-associated protein Cas6/Cse3/CasE n=1 Tax=Bacteria TaxID=2 RepID=UPI003F92B79D
MILTHLRLPRGTPHDTRWLHQRIAEVSSDPRPLWAFPRHGIVITQTRLGLAPEWAIRVSQGDLKFCPEGAVVQMALIANPTRSMRGGGGGRGTRNPLAEADWDGWFLRKLSSAVDVTHIAHHNLAPVVTAKPGHVVTLRRVEFIASGTVTDADALHALRISGVGSGKAYGCGLLLASEVRS